MPGLESSDTPTSEQPDAAAPQADAAPQPPVQPQPPAASAYVPPAPYVPQTPAYTPQAPAYPAQPSAFVPPPLRTRHRARSRSSRRQARFRRLWEARIRSPRSLRRLPHPASARSPFR